MKKVFWSICRFLFICGLTACAGQIDGGSEVGNPTRPVNGYLVADSSEEAPATLMTTLCSADTVIAKNSLNEELTATVAEDCSFTLTLPADKAYAVNFYLADAFVAKLIVQNSLLTLESPVFVLSTADATMDLGAVTIVGKKAFPEFEPATQNDQNGNDVNDFDDVDDDGDGVNDDAEIDCDLDGFFDDLDDDDDICLEIDIGDEDSGIVEASPNSGELFVETDDEVSWRANCDIDINSVNGTTFVVASATDVILCGYALSESNQEIECTHPDQDFLINTTYTATIAGILCTNGDVLTGISWSWTVDGE